MSCDLRLVRADARFRVPAARLGLGYAYEGVRMLVAKLGLGPTSDLLLSAASSTAKTRCGSASRRPAGMAPNSTLKPAPISRGSPGTRL
jgi:hypothetical protein